MRGKEALRAALSCAKPEPPAILKAALEKIMKCLHYPLEMIHGENFSP
jgi:hypothetical protein